MGALNVDLSASFALAPIKTISASKSALSKYEYNTSLKSTNGSEGIAGAPPTLSEEEEKSVQVKWNLFTKHQAKGQWRGTWTTYDYMTDVNI